MGRRENSAEGRWEKKGGKMEGYRMGRWDGGRKEEGKEGQKRIGQVVWIEDGKAGGQCREKMGKERKKNVRLEDEKMG